MSHLSSVFIILYSAFLLVFVFEFVNGIRGEIKVLQQKQASVTCSTSLFVDQSGKAGNFLTIQAAIDSIPSNNDRWVCIQIKSAVYREQVTIPFDKPFIYLKGEGHTTTIIQYDGYSYNSTAYATFTSLADNVVAESLAFMNSYNYPFNGSGNPMRAAIAAMVQGDKSAFYSCAFYGLQDTLWDVQGRHYFNGCTIQGAVDFIYGAGQSIYENCNISVIAEALNGVTGYITAQGRSQGSETSGFVFKGCNIIGNGKTFLGRAWRGFARVVFYGTSMADIVVPQGWDPWLYSAQEYQLAFEEADCHGPGSDTSGRVNWVNKMGSGDLQRLVDISFVDGEGWLKAIP